MFNKLVWNVARCVILGMLVVGCGSSAGNSGETPKSEVAAKPTEAAAKPLVPLKLQLQWVAQSQFAGFYAAVAQGFYKDEGLDVKILEGAVDIVPQQVVASGQADIAIASMPKCLSAREEGVPLINIGQHLDSSGSWMVSWADSGITKIEDYRGKKIGTWGYGNEYPLFAAMSNAGLDPKKDLTMIQQPFDMSLLLNREVDAAQAMSYNEYAQVLEAVNPKTGKLYQASDLTVISFDDVGTSMLEDGIYVTNTWLTKPGNEDVAERFLTASFRGWVYCRDNFDACVGEVLKNGTTLGKSHMEWQLNLINQQIWPSERGIGMMSVDRYKQTVDIMVSSDMLKVRPDSGAYRTDLAAKANSKLQAAGVDIFGANYKPQVVQLQPGGE